MKTFISLWVIKIDRPKYLPKNDQHFFVKIRIAPLHPGEFYEVC